MFYSTITFSSYISQVRFWNTQKSMCVGQFLAHEQGEYGDQSYIKISKSLGISQSGPRRQDFFNFTEHCT